MRTTTTIFDCFLKNKSLICLLNSIVLTFSFLSSAYFPYNNQKIEFLSVLISVLLFVIHISWVFCLPIFCISISILNLALSTVEVVFIYKSIQETQRHFYCVILKLSFNIFFVCFYIIELLTRSSNDNWFATTVWLKYENRFSNILIKIENPLNELAALFFSTACTLTILSILGERENCLSISFRPFLVTLIVVCIWSFEYIILKPFIWFELKIVINKFIHLRNSFRLLLKKTKYVLYFFCNVITIILFLCLLILFPFKGRMLCVLKNGLECEWPSFTLLYNSLLICLILFYWSFYSILQNT